MHVSVSRLRSQPPLVHLTILIVSLLPLYILSYQYRLRYPYGLGSAPRHRKAYPPSSASFAEKWLEMHLPSPFNPSPLHRYCNRTITWWRPNLTFHLPDANGGIGNIKGNFLDYIFYAIEAGATSLVLPSMASRSTDNLFDVWAGRQPFSAFFNETWFRETMAAACPQIRIVEETDAMLARDWDQYYIPPSRRVDEGADRTLQVYAADVDRWVTEATGQLISAHEKVEISVERRLWQFDTFSLPWDIRRELGQVLRIRDDLRAFAAEIVRNLGLQYGLALDAGEAVPSRSGGRFFGGHLRTESDAVQAGFVNNGSTDFETQADAMIHAARKHGLSTLYIATGEPRDLALLRHKCLQARPPLNVTSKFDLLSASSARELQRMTWDQQALVDFEVLMRSSFFVGMRWSSFAWQIALTRNQVLRDRGRARDPYEVVEREENVGFDDGWSRITGEVDGRVVRGMWP